MFILSAFIFAGDFPWRTRKISFLSSFLYIWNSAFQSTYLVAIVKFDSQVWIVFTVSLDFRFPKVAPVIFLNRNQTNVFFLLKHTLREKCPNTEFFLVRIFPHSDWIRRDTSYLSVFSPNVEKYGPEKTPYLDIFHAVTPQNNTLLSSSPSTCQFKKTLALTHLRVAFLLYRNQSIDFRWTSIWLVFV